MRLVVNGLEQEITYDRHAVEDLLLPRLRAWIDATGDGRRHVAFFAAPPGTGKSTLALILEQALAPRLQCLGIDGFHRTQTELDRSTMVDEHGERVPMASRKGAPETFDAERLDAALSALRRGDEVTWPVYDRRLHDVVPDGPRVTADHVLVEGNWLLLDEEPWSHLREQADLSVSIRADEDLLRDRLVGRKVRGGLDPRAAQAFYERSDGPNVRRCLDRSALSTADVVLTMGADGMLNEGIAS